MIRTLVVLAIGALLGVTATVLLRPQTDSVPAVDDSPRAPFSADFLAPLEPVTGPAPEANLELYRRLADADVAELGRMIGEAAGAPLSTDRDLTLAVLLKRYAELDVVGAVRLARQSGVRGAALGTVYGAWAQRAPGQVLAALSTIANPNDAADVALALIVTLGNDAAAVERVAGLLAARDEESGLTAAGELVESMIPPAGLGTFLPPRSALGIVAARWAELAPRRALAVARAVRDERVRPVFEAAALTALARAAPGEALAEMAKLGGSVPLPALGGALVELARADPERLLASSNELPAEMRQVASLAAMQQLATRDPVGALRHVERLPRGIERQMLTRLIALSYGKRDAAAALAWARSVPGQPDLVSAVIGGVAQQDPMRALDLALELTSPMERMQAVQFAAATGARTDADAEVIADRLLAVDDAALRESLMFNVVATWASRSPDNVMRWLLANGEKLSPNVFQQVGQLLALRDPSDAAAYAAQVPAAAREPWLNGVASGYAQNDPQGAVRWLRQFSGEAWYGRAATTVAMNVAHRDGAAAARLVDELDAELAGVQTQPLAGIIATNWANTEPAAAAAWALERRTEPERTLALRGAVGAWSTQDSSGARQWTLRLPQGGMRDAALTTLLTTSAYQAPGGLDAGLLTAFSSDAARQQAVMQLVQGFAYNDPARARTLVDAYVTEPAARTQAERILETAANGGQPPAGLEVVRRTRSAVQRAR